MCSSDEGEQGAAHGQQDQAAVQVEHGGRRSADAQAQLRNTHIEKRKKKSRLVSRNWPRKSTSC